MKFFKFFLFFSFFLIVNITAKNIDKPTAQQVAENFLNKLGRSERTNFNSLHTVNSLDKGNLAYVVDLEPQGFIIISADDNINPVIAYSFKSEWKENESADNAFLTLLSSDVKSRLQNVEKFSEETKNRIDEEWKNLKSENLSKIRLEQWPAEGSTSTGGWVETTWYQLDPYNKFCPVDLDEGKHSAVGCVASASAPIVDYWKSINNLQLTLDDEYTTRYLGINIQSDTTNNSFPSFKTLNTYLKQIETKYQSGQELNLDETAALNFAFGVLVEMDYSFSVGSGAYVDDAAKAMRERLGFASADWVIATEPGFYATLRENMMNAQPAVISILQSTICGPMHAIIADGYNTMDFYHLNFGWGASSPENISEAWYLLPKGMPSSYDVITDGIVNIRPSSVDTADYTVSKKFVDLGGTNLNTLSVIDSFTVNSDLSLSGLSISSNSDYFQVSLDAVSFSNSLVDINLNANEELAVYIQSYPDSNRLFKGYITISAENHNHTSVQVQCIGLPEQGTPVNAGKVESGTWTKENSPYYVCGDLEIGYESSLEIEPGVDVIFMGKFGIEAWGGGIFKAIGTEEDSIRFFPADTSVGWLGIDIIGMGTEDYVLAYCDFSGGKADLYHPQNIGGAIKIADASPTIRNSKFHNNFAFNGGAVYITGAYSNPIIKNCLFVDNKSTSMGGAVTVNGGFNTDLSQNVLFENVTIVRNYTTKMGGAMALNMGAKVTLRNSIVWDNTAEHDGKVFDLGNDSHNITKPDSLIFEYTDVDTSESDWLLHGEVKGYVDWGVGNLASDPLFNSYETNDFSLGTSSPCIDAGDPDPAYNDSEDPSNNGFACYPASGALRNDMGVYGGGSSTTTSVDDQSSLVNSFELKQNYPNPFNPETKISYSISERNLTTLKVYDILGREIVTLVNKVQEKGNYSFNLNASHLASGIYLYQLKSGNYSATRKMMLLK